MSWLWLIVLVPCAFPFLTALLPHAWLERHGFVDLPETLGIGLVFVGPFVFALVGWLLNQ